MCTSDLESTSDVQRHSTGMVRFTNSLQMKMNMAIMVVMFTNRMNTIIIHDLEDDDDNEDGDGDNDDVFGTFIGG